MVLRAPMKTDAQAAPPPFLTRAGGLLFRFRSFTPVPLLVALLPLLWRSRGAPHAALWAPLGLAACALGQALRAWVIGQVPDGTSGQNEALIATQLNASGPYAHTRNPLYLGNFLITLGLCLVAHDPWVVAIVAVAFGLQYRAIIAAEESFLRGRFGAAYDAFCARVPRFWPRLRVARLAGALPARAFSPRRALRKEHNPLAAWLCIALVLLALDRAAPALRALLAPGAASPGQWQALGHGLAPFAAALAFVLTLWLGVKAWKHRWLCGGFTDDLRRRLRETAR
jgi:protein-S-isoprenylcysteine O-methyltransferase Ste14